MLVITALIAAAEEPAFVKVFVEGWPNINQLLDEGFEVDTCKAPDDDGVFVYADSAERARLTNFGYQFEVIHAIANHPIDDPVITEPYMGGKATYDHYFNYVEMEDLLNQIADTLNGKVANTAQLIDIGDSEEGRGLIGIKISDNVNTEEMEPEVRLLGTHHGTEMISYMVMLYFLEQLADNFNETGYEEWTELVNGCEMWVVPVVNPDGVNDGFYHYEQADGYRTSYGSRSNANGVDLNRNYSYMWTSGPGHGTNAFSEPETIAVRDNHELNHYVISHSYHSGAYYINYVWNYTSEYYDDHPPPNRDLIYELCEIYDDYTNYGVTNGGDWYETNGDTNDWSYGEWGDVDTTIELHPGGQYGNDPGPEHILAECEKNDDAILQTLLAPLRYGVHGKVVVSTTDDTPVTGAVIWFKDLPGSDPDEKDWFSVNDEVLGDFYFMLLPGNYDATAEIPGYGDVDFNFTVPATGSTTYVTIYAEEGSADDEGETPVTPYRFELAQNKPNPASDATTFSFTLPRSCDVSLDVYDIKGRKVATPLEGAANIGGNEVNFDTSALANGVYLYRLSSDEGTSVRKMVVER
jgi:hypothetical protein